MNNDYEFTQYYRDDPEFYRYDEKFYAWDLNKRAQARTNYYPDIVNCELPLDNQRAPADIAEASSQDGRDLRITTVASSANIHRVDTRVHTTMRQGRCSSVSAVAATPYSWDNELGKKTPGKMDIGDQVNELHYIPGGFVAAAPGGGRWFHQHFGVSSDFFRVIDFPRAARVCGCMTVGMSAQPSRVAT